MDRKFYRDYFLFTFSLLSLVLIAVILISNALLPTNASEEISSRIFIIDAGHGGEDGGAVSVSGRPESMYNLEYATCMNDLLQLLGYRTHMLRTEDTDLHTQGATIAQRKVSDIKQRVSIVNQFHNATLISVHQNYFTDSRYSGLQVFYYNNTSKDLAERIQASYKSNIDPSSRRLAQRKQGVYLLEHAACDAVLVECGFLSNSEEEKLLSSKPYRQKLSSVILLSLLNTDIN